MDSLGQLAGGHGVNLKILAAAREVNHSISDCMTDEVTRAVKSLPGKEWAFRPGFQAQHQFDCRLVVY